MPMSEDERRLITETMVRHEGSMDLAATELGLEKMQLYLKIYKDAELHSVWIDGDAGAAPITPTQLPDVNTDDRPLPVKVPPQSRSQLELARRLAEDEDFGKSIESIHDSGISGRDLAVALANHHREWYARSMDMLGGGEDRLYLKIIEDIRDIDEELKKPQPYEREAILRRDRASLLAASQQIYQNAHKAILIKAMVEAKKNRGAKEKTQPRGFLAIPIQANEGSKVDIHISKRNGHKQPERDRGSDG